MKTFFASAVEIVDNPMSRYSQCIGKKRGYKNRNHLEMNHGKLLIYRKEEEQNYRMKNTKISLDIIFINMKFTINKL